MDRTAANGRAAGRWGKADGHVTLRPGALMGELDARGDTTGGSAKRMLERYLWVLRKTLPTLQLSASEAMAVAVALRNATFSDETNIEVAWAIAEKGLVDGGVADLYEVDAKELVGKLKGYSFAQSVALVDAVERFWRKDDQSGQELVEVGLCAKPR